MGDPHASFTTYAQNFEDVILWRALGHVESGFYVDVGAGEPEADSVTKAFYERGWTGVNVEPMPDTFARLQAGRPRDINVNAAVEDFVGEKDYFSVDQQNGLSTGVAELADQYRAEGWPIEQVTVSVLSLNELWARYVSRPVHFLKLDIEGSEAVALADFDLATHRPWVIVVESIVVATPSPASGIAAPPLATVLATPPAEPAWHDTLSSADYDFVYFDGLNRFYVAREAAEHLRAPINLPPNYFDHFSPVDQARLAEQCEALRDELRDAQSRADAAQEQAEQATELHQQAAVRLEQQAAEVDRLSRRLLSVEQELFEESRQVGWLAQDRQQQLQRADEIAAQLADSSARIVAADAQLASDAAARTAAENRVAELLGSSSWRLTSPARRASTFLASARRRSK